ncbi:sulfate adenylyltransferase subunit 1 [Bordetella sp. 02P26C-1]|uniref:sulfate adenylyltransferase subunit 1 n=1 Tax=Bordetella sp. 02P26C-1 TaxID=2683195 RepID=UPI0013526FC8|nr:GTP-binding protein [Bordetella sp. 02P26C-1]MVW78971.1 sulfate adenylyltransferase [Bordetella sp. 02P26C-1]
MNAVNDSFLPAADHGVLRLITAGSVDDGKSTLIGRLLYDSKGVFADQLDAISRAKYKRVAGDGIDFALLTDGLEAEREQGITIDVAYRYFSTPLRKFIVADAPGHEQYTRNMVTGASTADAAIILIDATRVTDGQLLTQTKRHSTIAHLLGIRHIVVAVNKMDLIGWDQTVFERIRAAYADLAARLQIEQYHVMPISALEGDNVVNRSAHTPWYDGPPLLMLLEQLGVDAAPVEQPLRFPVQWVLRHGGARVDDFRGYAGRIASGELRPGDEVVVQPSGVTARVKSVLSFDREVDVAVAGDSVTVVLDRDVDVSRGDVLSHVAAPARVGRDFEAEVCWLDAQALNPARKYLLKQGTRLTSAKVREVLTRRDIHELQEVPSGGESLSMNDIGRITFSTREALAVDAYADLPATGAFILIDAATHQTAAAGMLR